METSVASGIHGSSAWEPLWNPSALELEALKVGSQRLTRPARAWGFVGRGKAERSACGEACRLLFPTHHLPIRRYLITYTVGVHVPAHPLTFQSLHLHFPSHLALCNS